MNEKIYLPVLGIVAGELMMFSGNMLMGMVFYIINLQAISLTLIFSSFSSDIKKIHQVLLLPILMRIINLAMPQFFTTTLLWYSMIYGVMFLPIYCIVKNQQISLEEIGISSRRLFIYLPAAILIGTGIGSLEYRILHPLPLIENINFPDLVLIILVMFIFVGFVEELIFRSILQTRLRKTLGIKNGIFLSGTLFGIMHASYGIIDEILFASIFGIFLGYMFYKTGSLPFILTIHGTANVILFGVLPILSAGS